ncbi:MAG: hypothetical protein Q8P44_04635, partial [Dehalococcoidia bacterium]|nr:hypothetical protein [Dehalococcoidia bacterium]
MKVNRYFLAIFSVILILGLLASACGPKAEPTQAPAPARPAPTAAPTTAPPAPAQPTAAPTRPPVAAPTAAPTQSPMDKAAAFYKGKNFTIVAPYNPGGGYDSWARILGPFLGKHLGATAIVKNEPGAGAKLALNRLAKLNDGLSIILFSPRASLTAQI